MTSIASQDSTQILASAQLAAQAGEVAPRPVEWLVPGRLPLGIVTLLAGEPGSGKSLVAGQLAAAVASRRNAEAEGGVVVALSGPEPPARARARIETAGAEFGGMSANKMRHVRFLTAAAAQPGDGNEQSTAKPEKCVRLEALCAALRAAAPARLAVVDDLDGWCGAAGRPLSAAELAQATARLAEVAQATGMAVLALVRTAATADGRVNARVLDSLGRAAEMVWLVANDREPTGRHWLAPLKINLGRRPAASTFVIVDGRVAWLGEEPPPPISEVLSPGSARSALGIERRAAAEWLVSLLADDELPAKEVFRQAAECGISATTLRRAAADLGLRPRKTSWNGGWEWSLAERRGWVRGPEQAPQGISTGGDPWKSAVTPGMVFGSAVGSRPGIVGSRQQAVGSESENAEDLEDCQDGAGSRQQAVGSESENAEDLEDCQPAQAVFPDPRPPNSDPRSGIPPEPKIEYRHGVRVRRSVEEFERWHRQYGAAIRLIGEGLTLVPEDFDFEQRGSRRV